MHLALFVPWEDFSLNSDIDINNIWYSASETLEPRLQFHAHNITLLRRSAEDAKRDAQLWADRTEREELGDDLEAIDDNDILVFENDTQLINLQNGLDYVITVIERMAVEIQHIGRGKELGNMLQAMKSLSSLE